MFREMKEVVLLTLMIFAVTAIVTVGGVGAVFFLASLVHHARGLPPPSIVPYILASMVGGAFILLMLYATVVDIMQGIIRIGSRRRTPPHTACKV